MRGITFPGNRQVLAREFPDPRPSVGEVVIEIKASGICGSDLRPYRAAPSERAPVISGHEPCGVVAEVAPDVPSHVARVGDRVIVHHYAGCGTCKHCRIGYTQMCLRGHKIYGFSHHGANAPYMAVPASTLVQLPDSLGYDEGAAIACGTGTAYSALKRLAVSGRDTLAIYGQGPVGLSATMLGRAMGARVIAVDVDDERLNLARRHGAEATINPSRDDPVLAVRSLTDGEGAEATLDCTGNATARDQTVRSARAFGRACFVGEGGTVTLEPSPDVIHKQLTIYGSWTFSIPGLDEAARFIADRRVPLADLITHRYGLADAETAMRTFEAGGTGKCVFLVDAP